MSSTDQPVAKAPFIYLGGYPGVGKKTVAQEIVKILPNSRLIDNHRIIDLARCLFPHGSPEYEAFRGVLRADLLKAIAESESLKDTTFIFTGAGHSTNPISDVVARQFERAAAERGCPFNSIILSCDREEHLQQRVLSPTRGFKLTSTAKVERIIDSGPPYTFGCEREITIDTTGKTPEETAQLIVDYVQNK